MFAPIYYPYLAVIDSYVHMHFLNRVSDLFFGKFFESYNNLFFETEGVIPLVQKLISDQYDTSRKGLNYYSNNSFSY